MINAITEGIDLLLKEMVLYKRMNSAPSCTLSCLLFALPPWDDPARRPSADASLVIMDFQPPGL
jgi:hypothetical protein